MFLLWSDGLNKNLWALSVKKCLIDSKWPVPVIRRVLVQLGRNISIFSFVPTVNFLFPSLKRLLLVVFLQLWSAVGSALLFCSVLVHWCLQWSGFRLHSFICENTLRLNQFVMSPVCSESFQNSNCFTVCRQRIMNSGWLMSSFDRFHPPQLIFIHL